MLLRHYEWMKASRRIFAALLALGIFGSSQAQYPAKPIRMVVNFAPGGTSDIIARALQQPVGEALGKPVVIENRPGAQSALGTAEVARATPDGYTLLLTTKGAFTQIPALRSDLGYDPVKGFAAITMLGDTPLVLYAHPALPANDIKSLLAYAKRQPKGVDIAVSGASSTLAAAQLVRDSKVEFVLVPYQSQAPSVLAVLGGEPKLTMTTVTESLNEQVRAGKLKMLGITTLRASELVPGGVPIAQTLPGFSADTWWAVFAPAGTPKDIVDIVNGAFRKAMADPGMKQKFVSNGVSPLTSTPEELAHRVTTELAATRQLVQEQKIKVD
jgi:tripartite-type tricarboxylate transporter receptor subunit TctC